MKLRVMMLAVATLMLAGAFAGASARQLEEEPNLKFKFEPESIALEVNETMKVKVSLVNEAGEVFPDRFFLFVGGRGGRRSVILSPRASDSTGMVEATIKAVKPGKFILAARAARYMTQVQGMAPLNVAFPPLERVSFVDPEKKVYVGTTTSYPLKVVDKADFDRPEIRTQIISSDPAIANVDRFGNLIARQRGKVTLTAQAQDLRAKMDVEIVENPVRTVDISSSLEEARTGDVIRFTATPRNRLGQEVGDAPVKYTFTAKPDDNLAPAASGLIEQDGRFVAETPGLYTIIAASGPHSAEKTVKIVPRNVQQNIEVVGHGLVGNVFSSDLWVWEGVDGRDYAVTGTWGAAGETYFWDVTDPANMKIIDTVTVDARTVNDVKISEDGRICVISREGASNRRNGIVILDVTNPADVKIHSAYDEELTGGVHNVFIYENHVYAVNNGRRYDIINIEDPTKPHRVGRFELDTPGHSIHDVWIEDGIAYSSNWGDGLQLVDIGGATSGGPFRKFGEQPNPEVRSPFIAGGSPTNPIQFAEYAYPSGANHAAFPFHSESTKKFYVLAGDEMFPTGLGVRELKPSFAAGYIHFVDFTDIKNPKETARYEVPEAGSHNLWVENDILYVAFYQGGLRVVDISGELMGDLYRQGREIAEFRSMHSQGHIPNAPMVWGPMPYKGLIYFTDMNSGLWAVKLTPLKKRSDQS